MLNEEDRPIVLRLVPGSYPIAPSITEQFGIYSSAGTPAYLQLEYFNSIKRKFYKNTSLWSGWDPCESLLERGIDADSGIRLERRLTVYHCAYLFGYWRTEQKNRRLEWVPCAKEDEGSRLGRPAFFTAGDAMQESIDDIAQQIAQFTDNGDPIYRIGSACNACGGTLLVAELGADMLPVKDITPQDIHSIWQTSEACPHCGTPWWQHGAEGKKAFPAARYFSPAGPSPVPATLYDAYLSVRAIGRGRHRRLELVPTEKMPKGFRIDPAEKMKPYFVTFDFEGQLKTTAESVCRDLGFEPKALMGG